MRVLLATLAVALAGAAAAPAAQADVTWLCRPGLANDPCRPSLSTTVFRGFDERVGVVHPKVARRPKVDCFYVYPTVSDQPGTQAAKTREPAVRDIAFFQASRYSQLCRVFAPVYRQITVQGLQRADATEAQIRTAQADLTEAFRAYLRKDNRGRGFVLIGHSQGTLQLIETIRREVDRRPAVRRRMLSAILLEGNVTVRRGSDRGGVFANVPACRRAAQLGCLMAFSAFNTTPPPNARFGRGDNRYAEVFGQPRGAGLEVLCTNPAALGGGSARLRSIVPARKFAAGTLIGVGNELLQLPLPQASTTFVEGRGAFSGRCATVDGARVLQVASRAGTPVPKPSPDPTWGLHLLDANIAQGDLLAVLRRQIRAYARR